MYKFVPYDQCKFQAVNSYIFVLCSDSGLHFFFALGQNASLTCLRVEIILDQNISAPDGEEDSGTTSSLLRCCC